MGRVRGSALRSIRFTIVPVAHENGLQKFQPARRSYRRWRPPTCGIASRDSLRKSAKSAMLASGEARERSSREWPRMGDCPASSFGGQFRQRAALHFYERRNRQDEGFSKKCRPLPGLPAPSEEFTGKSVALSGALAPSLRVLLARNHNARNQSVAIESTTSVRSFRGYSSTTAGPHEFSGEYEHGRPN